MAPITGVCLGRAVRKHGAAGAGARRQRDDTGANGHESVPPEDAVRRLRPAGRERWAQAADSTTVDASVTNAKGTARRSRAVPLHPCTPLPQRRMTLTAGYDAQIGALELSLTGYIT